MKKIPVILDCDPGHDDAIAMLLACASPNLDVKAVTTVGGNQTVAKTTYNSLRILKFINQDIPVAAGADKPMIRPLETAPSVHGESGLDGPVLPEPDGSALDMTASELIAQVVENSDEPVTLIPTGPLTNIAVFLVAYPHLHKKIRRISLMGGSAVGGNWTGAAEFNILVDPEAADIVFRSGIPITMSGLDVTHRAAVYPNDIQRIRSRGGKVADLVADLLEFFIKFHNSIGWEFAPLHDPCAVACLIRPEMFVSKKVPVQIDLTGEFTTGCTVTDLRNVEHSNANTDVLLDVDRHAFIDLLIEMVDYFRVQEGKQ